MDFSLSEEQTLLNDSVRKYLENDYTFAERREIAAGPHGFSREHWANFAEFGWLTIPFADELGGFGGKIEDTAVLMEAFGRHLVLEPYLANILLAGQVIARSKNKSAIDTILSNIMDGSRQAALAIFERQSRQNDCDVLTTAESRDGGYRLNGTKVLVANGSAAQSLVVSARTSDDQLASNGISLFLVDAEASGITRSEITMMDGTRTAEIEFNGLVLPESALLGGRDEGMQILRPVLLEARIAICAQALGVMDELFNKTVEYSKTREQFGVPIGSFQALQHRMVDMFMGAAQARSIVYRAICEYQQAEPGAATTIAAMKSLVGKYARLIGTEAIQMHGGMGMTDELDIGHYVKSGMMLNQLLGDSDTTLREFCNARFSAQ